MTAPCVYRPEPRYYSRKAPRMQTRCWGGACRRRRNVSRETFRVLKSGGAGGTASCRGHRGGAPNPCAAAFFPQTSLRVRSTEDEDSPKGYRSPKPATLRGAGRKALFAGNSGQLGLSRRAYNVSRETLYARQRNLFLSFQKARTHFSHQAQKHALRFFA